MSAGAAQRSSGRSIPVIGIAGGIGSGKSSVARALGTLGALVSDSDLQIRAALETKDVQETLRSWWGDRAMTSDADVNRSAVAKIVFNDPAERERLETLLHPYALRARTTLIERAERERAPCVVIDAPLLFEAGLDGECDAVIFVDAAPETRLARLRETRGWDQIELIRREKAQLPLEQKRSNSDHVIINEGEEADLLDSVRAVLTQIRQDFSDANARPGCS